MCGRYTLTDVSQQDLVDQLDAEPAPTIQLPIRFNVAPGDLCVIVRPGASRPRIDVARWGLLARQRRLVNVRAETVKARFPRAWERGRCVVPADGFYEWTGARGERQPIWFHAPERGLLLMAGIVDDSSDPATFAVLTTASRPPVAAIHERMPLLLGAAGARRWLGGDGELAAGAPVLVAQAASERVNSVANDDAACLTASAEKPGQLRLF